MFRFQVLSAVLACAVAASLSVPSGLHPNGGRTIRRELVPDGRIIGGVPTTIDKYPYQVSLRYQDSHRCGGSIIKPEVILCAAHCVEWIYVGDLKVVAGTSHRTQGGVSRNVKNYIMHDNYNGANYDFDIAVIVLEKGFDLSPTIQSIPVASVNDVVRGGTKAFVSGWGTLAEQGDLPDILQYVTVTVVSNAQCAKDYADVNDVTDGMLCAGHPEGGRDACQGDSGGPLVVGGKLFGIVSWGYGCARPGFPGVYTKVSFFRDWFDDQLKALENEV